MKTIIILLLLLPSANAWNWQTHKTFADAFYYSVDENIREKIDLYALEEGSIVPDKDFKDFRRHSYPLAVGEAEKWIALTEQALVQQEYTNASFYFGIASHYIADVFSAPHGVSGEPQNLHSLYENQAEKRYEYAGCIKSPVDLENMMHQGFQEGATWGQWLKTKNPDLPRLSAKRAFLSLEAVGLHVWHGECQARKTEIKKVNVLLLPSTILKLALVVTAMMMVAISLYKDVRKLSKRVPLATPE